MAATLILAVVGLAGLVAGVIALRSLAKLTRTGAMPDRWRAARISAVVLGLALGVASWPLTYFMGYPVGTPSGPGRIVGLPFFVAFFDSNGWDYVGPLTLVGAAANSVFWFMVPQILLAVLGRRWRSERLQPASDGPAA